MVHTLSCSFSFLFAYHHRQKFVNCNINNEKIKIQKEAGKGPNEKKSWVFSQVKETINTFQPY